MTRCKKLLGAMLSILMVFALTPVMAFAASGTNNDDGTITIENATEGESYSLYQILKLESYNTDAKAYAYKAANDKWEDFLNGEDVKGTYFNQQNGYYSWIGDDNNASLADFSKLALKYAKDNGINPTRGPVSAEGTTVEFTDLNLGYYLLDSSMGTLCSLDTAAPDVTIKEKNSKPTVDKFVFDSEKGEWGSDNTANIGDTVSFEGRITVGEGASNYTFHDTMSYGLSWTGTVSVTNNGVGPIDASNYTVKSNNLSDGCTFEIEFTEQFCEKLVAGTPLVVSYSAILNKDAVIGESGNPNTCKLTYGDNNSSTEEGTTKTFTSGFDLVKTDADNVVLGVGEEVAEGDYATFKLFNAETDGLEIALVEIGEGSGVYRVATSEEVSAEGFQAATIRAGIAKVQGLAAGTYYLQELSAPNGYNMVAGRIPVTLETKYLEAETRDTTIPGDWDSNTREYAGYVPGHIEYVKGGVNVVNQTGSILPSTGGIGTTIFYIIGSLLVVGAVVYIVSRRRRSSSKEE